MANRLMLTLTDSGTGLQVTLPEPDPDHLGLYQATRLERLARRWCNPQTRHAAWAELDQFRGTAREGTLYGLSWLLAIWARLHEARTGTPAEQVIRDLDSDRAQRFERSAEEYELWEWLTHVVQLGALAALASDGDGLAAFERMATTPVGIDRLVVQHQLLFIDTFAQHLAGRLDLSPWGVTDYLVQKLAPAAETA